MKTSVINSNTSKMPMLTIITVVYNSGDLILETLQSVRSKKNESLEYIIIDGGSTDETITHIIEFKSSIDHYISERDAGIYDAMNKGIKQASGDYICFLNAGDTLADDFITKVGQYLNGQYDILSYGIQIKAPSGKLSLYLPEEIDRNTFNPQHMYLPHPGLLVKKTIFENYGVFDVSFKSSADLEWVNRIITKTNINIKYLYTPIVVFLAGGVSTSYLAYKESKNIAIIYGKSALSANYIFSKQVLLLFMSSLVYNVRKLLFL